MSWQVVYVVTTVGHGDEGVVGVFSVQKVADLTAAEMNRKGHEAIVTAWPLVGAYGPRPACPECGVGGDVGGTEPNPIPF